MTACDAPAKPKAKHALVDYAGGMKSAATTWFYRDHPRRARNVFLMMGYDPSPLRQRVNQLVRSAGADLGFDIIRADDTDYSGELWPNVQICLENCALGIAVFDRNDQSAQNLAVELGYLFAKEIPCLIMREGALPAPPAMLAHRLTTPFDAFDLESTFGASVERWLTERTVTSRRFAPLR